MSASPTPEAAITAARDAAKQFLRVEGADEDALLARLAGAAIALAEAFLGQALIVRGHEEAVAADGRWRRLRGEPVTAIAGVTATVAGETLAALPTDAFAVDIGADGRGWVRVQPFAGARARVNYTAGLALTWDDVPEPIAQGVTTLVAHLFDHREGDATPPAAVAALWRPYRRIRLGDAA